MNTLDTMTGEQNDIILAQYKKNEEANNHAENYLFLATVMQDEEAMMIAKFNMEFQAKFGYCDFNIKNATHEACNGYYYDIKALYA